MMKVVFVALALMCVLFTGAIGQSELTGLFLQGDANGLAALMEDPVELRILESEGALSREVARQRLQNFFSTNKVKSYEVKHSGTSKNKDTNYTIGELTTDRGIYRVFALFESRGGKSMIRELRIEDKG